MICRISNAASYPNITLQWLYTNSSDEAGTNGLVLTSDAQPSGSSMRSLALVLNLSSQPGINHGYYWCMVGGLRSGTTQNPSQIVQIGDSCFQNKCMQDIIMVPQSNHGRCANGDFNEALVILDLLDTATCPVTTTMMGASSTTEGEILTDKVTESQKPLTSTPANTMITGDSSTSGSLGPNPPTTTTPTQGTSVGGDVAGLPTGTPTTTTPTQGTSVGGGAAGLPTGTTWLIVGVGIAVLLVVIAVLLVIITCLQCSRRRVKGKASRQCVQLEF